jgi:hypothetical protein
MKSQESASLTGWGGFLTELTVVLSCGFIGCSQPCSAPAPTPITIALPLASLVTNADAGDLGLRPVLSELLLGTPGPDDPEGIMHGGLGHDALTGMLASIAGNSELATYTQPTTIQLGLNDPCFGGASGGVGFSLAATLMDLADSQCRQQSDGGSMNSLCDPKYLGLPSKQDPNSPIGSLPIAATLTPAALACTEANGLSMVNTLEAPNSNVVPDCTYGPGATNTCVACNPSGDAMGNPHGLFIGLDATSEKLYARFPDSVMANQLPNELVDPISFALTSGFAGSPPIFGQSFEQCGISVTNTCNPTPPFGTLSAWFTDDAPNDQLVLSGLTGLYGVLNSNYAAPVMGTLTSNGIQLGGTSPAPNLFVLNLHANPVSAEGTAAGLVSEEVAITAIVEVASPATVPPVGISGCDWIYLFAPPQITLISSDGKLRIPFANPAVDCLSCSDTDISGGKFVAGVGQVLAPLFNAGFILQTPGYCVSNASIASASGSGVAGAVALQDVQLETALGVASATFLPPPTGNTPSVYLQVSGSLDPTDPPDPPAAGTASASGGSSSTDPADGGSPAAGGDPTTFIPTPTPGQPIEALGMTYQSAPGFIIEAVQLGTSAGPVQQGVVAAPLWPLPVPFLVRPKTRLVRVGPPMVLPAPDDYRAILPQANPNPFFDYLSEPTDGGVQDVAWAFPFGAFPDATQYPFFYGGLLAAAGPQVMAQPITVGETEYFEDAIIYTCSDAGPLWTHRVPAGEGSPFASYPVWTSASSVLVLAPGGAITMDGGEDAGDPPPLRPTLADFVPPDALQAFAGPVSVIGFAQRSRRVVRCREGDGDWGDESFEDDAAEHVGALSDLDRLSRDRGNGDQGDQGWGGNRGQGQGPSQGDGNSSGCGRGRWRDDRGRCCENAGGDPPADAGVPAEFGLLGDGVLLTNAAGETLAIRPSPGVSQQFGSFVQALCGGPGAQVQETVSVPLSEFNSCGPCGNPVVPPGPGQCCWTQQEVAPAVLGIKTVSYDLYEEPAVDEQPFIMSSSGTTSSAFGVGSWPNDPGTSYIIGPVGASTGDGGRAIIEELFQLPASDTISIVGASDRLLTDQATGQPLDTAEVTQQPIDLSCLIGPDGANPSVIDLVDTSPLTNFINYIQYIPNPSDEVQLSILLPGPLHTGASVANVLTGNPSTFSLPFDKAIAPGGSDECTFLDHALSAPNQPVASVSYALPANLSGNTPIWLSATPPSGGSGCGETVARVDAIELSSVKLPGSGVLVVPGALFAPAPPQSPFPATAWWIAGNFNPAIGSVQAIVSNGVTLGVSGVVPQSGGSCVSNADPTGSQGQVCIPSGQTAGVPAVQNDLTFSDINCCSGQVVEDTGFCQ